MDLLQAREMDHGCQSMIVAVLAMHRLAASMTACHTVVVSCESPHLSFGTGAIAMVCGSQHSWTRAFATGAAEDPVGSCLWQPWQWAWHVIMQSTN